MGGSSWQRVFDMHWGDYAPDCVQDATHPVGR